MTTALSPLHQAFKRISVEIYQIKTALSRVETQAGQLDEAKAKALIKDEISKLTNGASEAFDTLKEIEDAITSGSTAAQEILSKIDALKKELTAIKAYIGFDERDNLIDTINQYLTTGA